MKFVYLYSIFVVWVCCLVVVNTLNNQDIYKGQAKTSYNSVVPINKLQNDLMDAQVQTQDGDLRLSIIACSADGKIQGINLKNGEVSWSFDVGTPLLSNSYNMPPQYYTQNTNDKGLANEQELQVDGQYGQVLTSILPGTDGYLYLVKNNDKANGQDKVQRIALLRDLVDNSVFSYGDSQFIGSVATTLYVYDKYSGNLETKIRVDSQGLNFQDKEELQQRVEQGLRNLVALQRTDYVAISVNPLSGVLQWNVSYSKLQQYMPFNMTLRSSDLKLANEWEIARKQFSFKVDHNDQLTVSNSVTGFKYWTLKFNSTPLYLFPDFLPLPYNLLQQEKLIQQNANPQMQEEVQIKKMDNYGYFLVPSVDSPADKDLKKKYQILEVEDIGECVNIPGMSVQQVSSDANIFALPNVFSDNSQAQQSLPGPVSTQEPEVQFWSYKNGFRASMVVFVGGISFFAYLYYNGFGIMNLSRNYYSSQQVGKRVVSDNGRKIRIGSIVHTQKVLGTGAAGTVVYEGSLQSRPVAVKRMMKIFYERASRELELLVKADNHPNIVRCMTMEEDEEFVYLCMERCQMTLAQALQNASTRKKLVGTDGLPTDLAIKIAFQLSQGLQFLHSIGIVHRDVKPQNVLITDTFEAKLSDMGLSKLLEEKYTSFESSVQGSLGWQAPELLTEHWDKSQSSVQVRQSHAVDIFSMGCLIFYVLTGGQHPYGEIHQQNSNIILGRHELQAIKRCPEVQDLVACMLHRDPKRRPSMESVLAHPCWWSADFKLQFLIQLSDRVELLDRSTSQQEYHNFEGLGWQIFGDDGWANNLDQAFICTLDKYRKYNYESLRDLLRAIRNKHNHYRELSEDARNLFGDQLDGYIRYFQEKFPFLLLVTYLYALRNYSQEEHFKKYFPNPSLDFAHISILELSPDLKMAAKKYDQKKLEQRNNKAYQNLKTLNQNSLQNQRSNMSQQQTNSFGKSQLQSDSKQQSRSSSGSQGEAIQVKENGLVFKDSNPDQQYLKPAHISRDSMNQLLNFQKQFQGKKNDSNDSNSKNQEQNMDQQIKETQLEGNKTSISGAQAVEEQTELSPFQSMSYRQSQEEEFQQALSYQKEQEDLQDKLKPISKKLLNGPESPDSSKDMTQDNGKAALDAEIYEAIGNLTGLKTSKDQQSLPLKSTLMFQKQARPQSNQSTSPDQSNDLQAKQIGPDSHINEIYNMIVRERGGVIVKGAGGIDKNKERNNLENQFTLQSKVSDISLAANLGYDGSGTLSKQPSRQFQGFRDVANTGFPMEAQSSVSFGGLKEQKSPNSTSYAQNVFKNLRGEFGDKGSSKKITSGPSMEEQAALTENSNKQSGDVSEDSVQKSQEVYKPEEYKENEQEVQNSQVGANIVQQSNTPQSQSQQQQSYNPFINSIGNINTIRVQPKSSDVSNTLDQADKGVSSNPRSSWIDIKRLQQSAAPILQGQKDLIENKDQQYQQISPKKHLQTQQAGQQKPFSIKNLDSSQHSNYIKQPQFQPTQNPYFSPRLRPQNHYLGPNQSTSNSQNSEDLKQFINGIFSGDQDSNVFQSQMSRSSGHGISDPDRSWVTQKQMLNNIPVHQTGRKAIHQSLEQQSPQASPQAKVRAIQEQSNLYNQGTQQNSQQNSIQIQSILDQLEGSTNLQSPTAAQQLSPMAEAGHVSKDHSQWTQHQINLNQLRDLVKDTQLFNQNIQGDPTSPLNQSQHGGVDDSYNQHLVQTMLANSQQQMLSQQQQQLQQHPVSPNLSTASGQQPINRSSTPGQLPSHDFLLRQNLPFQNLQNQGNNPENYSQINKAFQQLLLQNYQYKEDSDASGRGNQLASVHEVPLRPQGGVGSDIIKFEVDPEDRTKIIPEYPQREGAKECGCYMRTGWCKYGAKCKYNHPSGQSTPLNAHGNPLREGDSLCKHYMQYGYCKFGGYCKFHHPALKRIVVKQQQTDDGVATRMGNNNKLMTQ